MNIAVDIGNTRLKYAQFFSDGWLSDCCEVLLPKKQLADEQFCRPLLAEECFSEAPITWRIAATGPITGQQFKAAILPFRPRDQFEILDRHHIPLELDVEFPDQLGLDRLLSAFAAVNIFGNIPLLVVDAGTAITADAVNNRIFCGGAILPGLTVCAESYPQISAKLPLIPLNEPPPEYPGKNTSEAIRNGIYWGTIGAIRQFADFFSRCYPDGILLLTGGDAEYLLNGLRRFIPDSQIVHKKNLVLQGIQRCLPK